MNKSNNERSAGATTRASDECSKQVVEPPAGFYPLSPAQSRVWFLTQFSPGSTAYLFSASVHIQGNLNVAALRAAFQNVIDRQEALRISIQVRDGVPGQVIIPDLQCEMPIHEISSHASNGQAKIRDKLFSEMRATPFDISAGPLFHLALVRSASEEHVLLFTAHHLIWDAWSWRLFWEEAAAFYNSGISGSAPGPGPLSTHYTEYCLQQRKAIETEAALSDKDYWLHTLQDAPPLRLQTDRSRPGVLSERGALHAMAIDPELRGNLRAFALRSRSSPFIVALAAFYAFLHYYTADTDLTVGTAFAGREDRRIRELIGFFVQTLALRVRVTPEITGSELIARTSETVLGAHVHREFPFERLIEFLNPPRDTSRTPLFQVMFLFRDVVLPPASFNGLSMYMVENKERTSKFDITVQLALETNEPRLEFEYNPDLYDDVTVARMSAHYVAVLGNLITAPQTTIGSLNVSAKTEHNSSILAGNTTKVYPSDSPSLHTIFERQVHLSPDALALIWEGGEWSYARLNLEANRLAHNLQRYGVARGSVVAIGLDTSAWMVAAVLAVLKAGAAYLPLEPEYPTERLHFMLKDSKACCLITNQAIGSCLRDIAIETLFVDHNATDIEQENEENPLLPTVPDDPAYVIYTSGSTGRPKGVVGLHKGVINRLAWMWNAYPFQQEERCCVKTVLSFVDSVAELFSGLLQGVPTVLCPRERTRDPRRFVDFLSAFRVTRIVLTPSLLQAMLTHVDSVSERLPDLRFWVSSGEALSVDLTRQFHRTVRGATLLNLYGSSEVSADVTFFDTTLLPDNTHIVPIGLPISNTRIFVLGSLFEPVPLGAVGEICVAGESLAACYLRQPELTAEKFVSITLADGSTEFLFRTGDIGRRNNSGFLEYLGRTDGQIKVRGHRVETGEIETVLAMHADIQSLAVVALPGSSGNLEIAAFFTVAGSSVPGEQSLRAWAARSLPPVMVPTHFVPLRDLPLLPNGKTDRASLVLPENGHCDKSPGGEEIFDALEAQLAGLWGNVLNKSGIRLDDSFFDFGGHSLTALVLIARLEKLVGASLPLTALFQAPTVRQFACFLRNEAHGSPFTALVPLRALGSRPPLFCVHAHGGSVLNLRRLLPHLAVDQPLYGLQSPALDGKCPPSQDVREMACHYANEVRRLRPKGLFILAGMCNIGGAIALEMARIFEQDGRPTAALILIDSEFRAPSRYRPDALLKRSPLNRFVQKADEHIKEMARLNISGLSYWLGRIHKRFALAEPWKQKQVAPDVSSCPPPHIEHIHRAHQKALADYIPAEYSGKITLLLAAGAYVERHSNFYLTWAEVARGGLEVHLFSGEHSELFQEPEVIALAARIDACIKAACPD